MKRGEYPSGARGGGLVNHPRCDRRGVGGPAEVRYASWNYLGWCRLVGGPPRCWSFKFAALPTPFVRLAAATSLNVIIGVVWGFALHFPAFVALLGFVAPERD